MSTVAHTINEMALLCGHGGEYYVFFLFGLKIKMLVLKNLKGIWKLFLVF